MFEAIKNIFKSKKQKLEEEKHKALLNDISVTIGILLGNELSKNSQNATDAMTEGMKLFIDEADRVANVNFEQAKGNFFEYIEAAKFNAEAAKHGEKIVARVTATGQVPNYNCHSEADIVLIKNDTVIKEIQAKTGTNSHDLVRYHTGFKEGLGKYDGMDRLIPKDNNNAMLNEAKEYAKTKSEMGLFDSNEYKDVHDHLTNELHSESGIRSGGTSLEELKEAKNNPKLYAEVQKMEQLECEMIDTATNSAVASAVTTGVISTVKNVWEIFKDGKEIGEALKEIGKDCSKSAVRGAVAGIGAANIRYFGNTNNIPIIKEACASAVIAGSAVDCGVSIWKYANGEINSDELKEELAVSTVKGVATVFFTKGIGCVLGAATGAILPIAVYSTLSVVISSGYAIVKKSKMKKAEYERIEVLLKELNAQKEKYYKEILLAIKDFEKQQKYLLQDILKNIDNNLLYGNNYMLALNNFSNLSKQLGISLKYETESEFKRFMLSSESLIFE